MTQNNLVGHGNSGLITDSYVDLPSMQDVVWIWSFKPSHIYLSLADRSPGELEIMHFTPSKLCVFMKKHQELNAVTKHGIQYAINRLFKWSKTVAEIWSIGGENI